MVQYTKRSDDKATDMMWDAGLGGGGPYVYCSCGKDHSLPPDLSDDEYESADCFYYIELDGMLFVFDCEGCKVKLRRYENFIWNNKDTIRRYLKIRIDQEKAWAEQQHLLNVLSGIN